MKKLFLNLFLFLAIWYGLYAEEDYLKKAEKYFKEGKFSLAEIFYKKVLESSPDNFNVNYNLGKIYYYKNKFDLAIKYLETAYDIKSEKDIQFLIANCYIEKNQIQKGMTIYSNLLNEYSDYADVHLNAGLVYLKYLYNKEGTIYHWEEFLKLKPDDPQAPAIRKALQYLKDPNFVLKPPLKKGTKTKEGLKGGEEIEEVTTLPITIKGKDLKTKSEEKYKLKGKKSITTE